jgi:hypothetical protein
MSTYPAAFGRRNPIHAAAARAPRLGFFRAWGWLEWMILAQTAIPALLFVPGVSPIRTFLRVASFLIALLAWAVVGLSGRKALGRGFPAAPWLAAGAAWLAATAVLHPRNNSLAAGFAQAALNIAILCPALWGGAALRTSRQVPRIMALLLLCNGLSALVGIAQFYRPETFNPPVIPILATQQGLDVMLSFATDDGRRVLRPCGLTDTPGGAATAGSLAALVGLCWALRPMAGWKRLACLGLSLAGATVLYLSQSRSNLIVLVLCIGILAALLVLRRDYRRAGLLSAGGAAIIVAGLAWVFLAGASSAAQRFTALLESRPDQLYYRNRGFFVEDVFTNLIWDYPLGAGLGWWGQTYAYFGDKTPRPGQDWLWIEIQFAAWVIDGGVPLMVIYVAALALAMLDSIRIARTCKDEEIGFWAAVICALGMTVVTQCFSAMPFISPSGVQFWVLAAAVHAADGRLRAEATAAARRRAALAAAAAPAGVSGAAG